MNRLLGMKTNCNWEDGVNAFLYYCAARGLSKSTVESYSSDLKILQRRLRDVGVLSEALSRISSAILQDVRGDRSVIRLISVARSFIKFCKSERYIPTDFEVELPTIKRRALIPRALGIEQIASILSYARKQKGIAFLRLSALLELMYSSGMRISEALSLKVADVVNTTDALKDIAIISGKGGRERMIFINEPARKILSEYLSTLWGSGYSKFKASKLFIGGRLSNKFLTAERIAKLKLRRAMTRQRVFQEIRAIGVAVNLPQELSPHVLRHSFATHLLSRNMNIRYLQELLGHKSINTTQIYTKVVRSGLKKMLRGCHPLFDGGIDI